MARLTLGDQVSIVSTGEKGTIVGESNGLYDVRIGGAGTMETRRGVRRRDLERFVPEFSSPFNGTARPSRLRDMLDLTMTNAWSATTTTASTHTRHRGTEI